MKNQKFTAIHHDSQPGAGGWSRLLKAAASVTTTGHLLRRIERTYQIFFLALILLGMNAASVRANGTWKAGTVRVVITPTEPMWLAGFANQTNPATGGKLMDLWGKALALEDASGHRAVILTVDLLGILQNIYRNVTSEIAKKYALKPEQVLLCELTQDKGYRRRGMDEGFKHTLTHIRGYRNNEHEFSSQTRVSRQDSRSLWAGRTQA